MKYYKGFNQLRCSIINDQNLIFFLIILKEWNNFIILLINLILH